jgi:hypothetical protein
VQLYKFEAPIIQGRLVAWWQDRAMSVLADARPTPLSHVQGQDFSDTSPGWASGYTDVEFEKLPL